MTGAAAGSASGLFHWQSHRFLFLGVGHDQLQIVLGVRGRRWVGFFVFKRWGFFPAGFRRSSEILFFAGYFRRAARRRKLELDRGAFYLIWVACGRIASALGRKPGSGLGFIMAIGRCKPLCLGIEHQWKITPAGQIS